MQSKRVPTPEVGGSDDNKGDSIRWRSMLRRWLVECPRCLRSWIVVGARENDSHRCKDCGHDFVITFSNS